VRAKFNHLQQSGVCLVLRRQPCPKWIILDGLETPSSSLERKYLSEGGVGLEYVQMTTRVFTNPHSDMLSPLVSLHSLRNPLASSLADDRDVLYFKCN
jgi:hypothetical protein